MDIPSGYDAVMRLATERPDWIPAVIGSVIEAQRRERFAGSWALGNVEERLPNLKPLVTYGILIHDGSTRKHTRAYYKMPDVEGVTRALNEMGIRAEALDRHLLR